MPHVTWHSWHSRLLLPLQFCAEEQYACGVKIDIVSMLDLTLCDTAGLRRMLIATECDTPQCRHKLAARVSSTTIW